MLFRSGSLVLERVAHSAMRARKSSGLIVATSIGEDDDAVERWCSSIVVPCFRGPLDDVLERVSSAAAFLGFDAFVRVCADSPLIDSALIDHAIELMRSEPCDVVTNVHPRRFPKGQSVEVVTLDAAGRLHAESLSEAEREHVTVGFYARPNDYAITCFEPDRHIEGLPSVVVDTPEDFQRIERMIQDAGPEADARRWWQWIEAA